MRRREFITLVGGAAAWPLATHAQPTKMPTIGFLGTATPSTWSKFVAAFVQRLRDLGWVEGRNVAIVFRWAEGRTERYTEIATEFVQLKVDVIVTSGGAVLATKQATSVIPIVFALALDPVGSGMVASLARPGGNITGLSSSQPIFVVSGSNSCARLFLISAGWQSLAMPATPMPLGKWPKFKQRPARSALSK